MAEDHEGLRELARETVMPDVVMPKISGPEVYARISAEKPETPVLFATGYSADMAMLQKIQDQHLPVLQKPYSPRDLVSKVRETLDQRSQMLSRP